MYDDRTNAEQLTIVAAAITILISRKLTVDEMGLVGDFLDVLGDMLQVMQSQIQYDQQIKRRKFRKPHKKLSKESSNY